MVCLGNIISTQGDAQYTGVSMQTEWFYQRPSLVMILISRHCTYDVAQCTGNPHCTHDIAPAGIAPSLPFPSALHSHHAKSYELIAAASVD